MVRAFVSDGATLDDILALDPCLLSIWNSLFASLTALGVMRNNSLEFVGIIDSEEFAVTIVCLPKTMLPVPAINWKPGSQTSSKLAHAIQLILKVFARYFSDTGNRRLYQDNPGLEALDRELSRYVTSFEVLDDWKRNGPITELRKRFGTAGRGPTDWARTIAHARPYIENGTPFYVDPIMRLRDLRHNHLVAQIQRACVLRAFAIVGWLDPSCQFIHREVLSEMDETVLGAESQWIAILNTALQNEFSQDRLQTLTLLLAFLRQTGSGAKTRLIGIQDFEVVWQGVLGSVLGDQYAHVFEPTMPQPRFFDSDGRELAKKNLKLVRQIPDIVFKNPYDDAIHVVDAKYYDTSRSFVGWSDIGKQFLYAHSLQQAFPSTSIRNSFIFPAATTDRTTSTIKVLDSSGKPLETLGSIYCHYWDLENVLNAYVRPSASVRERYRNSLRSITGEQVSVSLEI